MNHHDIQSALQTALENEIHPDQIRLWPAVAQRLAVGKRPLSNQGDASMKTIFHRTALIVLAVIVGFALLFATPQGQAFAQSILQFFIRTPGDTLPMPSAEPVKWIDVTPDVPSATLTPVPAFALFAAECGDRNNPTCSVEQIRGKVNFTIKELGEVPGIQLNFIGTTGSPDSVNLLYKYQIDQNKPNILIISEERWTGQPIQGKSQIGASAVVEKVQIGSLTGEYYKGSFTTDGAGDAKWDANIGTETLRWLDGDTLYTVECWPDTPFGKTNMVAVAKSMTSESVAKTPMPMPTEQADYSGWNPHDTYPLSISQAEEQAGFKPLLPGILPETLSLVGAAYNADHKVVKVYYLLDQNAYGPSTDGFTLSQQIAPNPKNCDLCDITVGDYNKQKVDATYVVLVPKEANIEIVPIGALKGKYTQGVWSGTDCCGWVWDATVSAKTLRWWANGRAFELSYFGENFGKADMIRIAENSK